MRDERSGNQSSVKISGGSNAREKYKAGTGVGGRVIVGLREVKERKSKNAIKREKMKRKKEEAAAAAAAVAAAEEEEAERVGDTNETSRDDFVDVNSTSSAAPPVVAAVSKEKRIKKLNKTLKQITELKAKRDGGEALNEDQGKKIATEEEVRRELDGLIV